MDKYSPVISLIAEAHDKAYRHITRELEAEGVKGLAPSHGGILVELFRAEPLKMNELSTRIRRDKSTVTALVAKLEKLGYIRRRKDREDQRSTLIELTEKGRSLEPLFFRISTDILEILYRDFSVEEKDALIRSLNRIIRNLE